MSTKDYGEYAQLTDTDVPEPEELQGIDQLQRDHEAVPAQAERPQPTLHPTTVMPLHELVENYQRLERRLAEIARRIEDADGVVDDELDAELRRFDEALDRSAKVITEKLDAYKHRMDELENDAVAFEARGDHYNALAEEHYGEAAARRKEIADMERRIHEHMQILGTERVEGEWTFEIVSQGGSRATDVKVPAEELPDPFRREKYEVRFNGVADEQRDVRGRLTHLLAEAEKLGITVKRKVSADRTALKKAIKAGDELAMQCAELKPRGTKLKITPGTKG